MKQLIILAACLFMQPVWAGWSLNNQQSTLNFVSTKNSSKTEVHSFKTLSGSLSDQGKAVLNIDLASVETNISIRNERMQKYLFQVEQFTTATVSLLVSSKKISGLKAGDSINLPVSATLNLHGVSKPIKATLKVVALNNGGLYAVTESPIILKVDDFNLIKGLKKLQELAKLKSIDSSVPITLSLVFDKAN